MGNETIEIKNILNRVDYISIDGKSALSSEGTFFKVGDKVYHEGDDKFILSEILSFYIDNKTVDIIAVTEAGDAKISFLYSDEEEMIRMKKIKENEDYRKKLGKPVNPETIGTDEDPQIPQSPSDEK